MDSAILTVLFGGEWKNEEGAWVFVGKQSSKAFVIEKNISLDGLKRKIVERFHVDLRKYNVVLSHMHPNNEEIEPFCIDEDEDLHAFLKINEMSNVAWSLPLHVVLDRSSCGMVDGEMHTSCDDHPVALVVDVDADSSTHYRVSTVDNLGSVQLNVDNFGSVPLNTDEGVEDRNIGGEDSNVGPCIDEFFGVAYVGDELVSGDGEAGYRCSNDIFQGSEDCNVAHDNDDQEDLYQSDGLHAIDPNIENDERKVENDQIFPCKQDLNAAVSLLAVRDNFEFKVKKSTKSLWVVGCIDVSCEWMLRATRLEASNYFKIRKYTETHSCTLANRNAHHRQATYKLIAKRIRKR